MLALDRAKRLSATLCKVAERRDRLIEKANSEFRLDVLGAIEDVDPGTIGLVLRSLGLDRSQEYLQLTLQMALDEQAHARRGALPPGEDDPHEAETLAPPLPPAPLPPSLDGIDEDLILRDLDEAAGDGAPPT